MQALPALFQLTEFQPSYPRARNCPPRKHQTVTVPGSGQSRCVAFSRKRASSPNANLECQGQSLEVDRGTGREVPTFSEVAKRSLPCRRRCSAFDILLTTASISRSSSTALSPSFNVTLTTENRQRYPKTAATIADDQREELHQSRYAMRYRTPNPETRVVDGQV